MKKITSLLLMILAFAFSSNAQNGAALDFDGINDRASIANNSSLNVNQFTIETWLKWDSSSAVPVPFVCSKGIENMEIHITKSNKSLRFIPTGGVFIDTDANSLPENTWVHVACVYNPYASLAKIYINGVEMNTTKTGANPLTTAVSNNTNSFIIGSRIDFSFPFKGAFDEFRIWNKALTQTEIVQRFNCEIPTVATGLIANLHFNQGVAGLSNTAIAAISDVSGFNNNATLTNFDLTGATSNFIATGGVVSNTTCTNFLAAALDFDGVNDNATIANNSSLNVNQFTIETWLKWDETSAVPAPFICANGFENKEIHINKSNNSLRFIPIPGIYVDTNANTLMPGTWWTHIACVYNPATSLVKIYINGTDMAVTITGATPLNTAISNSTSNFVLGSRTNGSLPFKGALDEFRFWNRALTQAEIQGRMNCEIPTTACGLITNLHFNQGVAGLSNTAITAITDSSGFNNNAALTNFDLTGTSSNFIATGGVVSNTSCTNILTAAPTANATQTFCGNATIASLTATGANLLWYANATGGTAIATSTTLTNNITYYVSQTANGCESARTAVNVAINTRPPAPTATELQILCSGSTIADLVVTGSNLLWYDNNSDGSPISTSTTLVNAYNYFVTQTVNGCESESRTWINVALNPTPAPTATALQILCWGSTIADLTVTGSNLLWYNSNAGGSPIATSTTLINAGFYFVSQTLNGCESARTAVNVAINTRPSAPTATATQSFCGSGTIANLTATGTILKWYATATGGTAFATSTALVNNTTYYVSQTVNGCESASRTSVAVTINLIPTAPTATATQTFCGNATIASLTATGTNLLWYANATGGTALATSTTLVNATTYYASQTVNGCESTSRTAVTVTIEVPKNIVLTPATFCDSAANKTISSIIYETPIETIGLTGDIATSNWTVQASDFHNISQINSNFLFIANPTPQFQNLLASVQITLPFDAKISFDWKFLRNFLGSVANYHANAFVRVNGVPTTFAPTTGGNNSGNYEVTILANQPFSINLQTFNDISDFRFIVDNFKLTKYPAIASIGSYNWSASNGGSILSNTTNSSVNIGTSGTYQLTYTSAAGCITSSSVVATVAVTPLPIAAATQTFCFFQPSVDDIVVTGTNLKYYATATSNTIIGNDNLINSNTYYITQSINECESERVAVTVTILPPLALPTAATTQFFCQSSTIANLSATGTNLKWYATATGGTPLASATPLTDSAAYYVSQSAENGCESARVRVVVEISNLVVNAGSDVTFCASNGSAITATVPSNTGALLADNFYTGAYHLSNWVHSGSGFVDANQSPNPTAIRIAAFHNLAMVSNNIFTENSFTVQVPETVIISFDWSFTTGGVAVGTYGSNGNIPNTPMYRIGQSAGITFDDFNPQIHYSLPEITKSGRQSVVVPANSLFSILMNTTDSSYQLISLNISNFKVRGAGSLTSSNWSASNGGSFSGDASSLQITPLTSGTYTFSGTSNNGCSASDSVEVFVRDVPIVSLSDANFCASSTNKTIRATTNTPPYTSYFPNGEIALNLWTPAATPNCSAQALTVYDNENSLASFALEVNGTGSASQNITFSRDTKVTLDLNFRANFNPLQLTNMEIFATVGTQTIIVPCDLPSGNARTGNRTLVIRAGQTLSIGLRSTSTTTPSEFVSGLMIVYCATEQHLGNYQWSTPNGQFIGDLFVDEITISQAGDYQLTYTSPQGCSTTVTTTATITNVQPPTASVTQAICNNSTIADLAATGTDLKWYAAATGGTVLASTTALVNNTTYYVSQTVNGCESLRTAVAITISTRVTPFVTTTNTYTFCQSQIPPGFVLPTMSPEGITGTWSPALNTSANATTVYTFTPTAGLCANTVVFTVTILAVPTAPVANSPQTFCGFRRVSHLAASGTALKWYSQATGGVQLQSSNILTTSTYYVSQTVNGCESTRTAVNVTAIITHAPMAFSSQNFCGSATVAALVATGSNIKWYADGSSMVELASTTILVDQTTYYASQTINGCESESRAAVNVRVYPIPTAPTANTTQTFCGIRRVISLVATGTNLKWYSQPTGGSALAAIQNLSTTTYYVSQTVNGCESPRTAVNVIVNDTPAPTAAATQTVCSSSTIANLTATGTNLKWYEAATGGTALATSTTLVNNTTYYVSQTINGCESFRTEVAVTIESGNVIVLNPNTFCSSEAVKTINSYITELPIVTNGLTGDIASNNWNKQLSTFNDISTANAFSFYSSNGTQFQNKTAKVSITLPYTATISFDWALYSENHPNGQYQANAFVIINGLPVSFAPTSGSFNTGSYSVTIPANQEFSINLRSFTDNTNFVFRANNFVLSRFNAAVANGTYAWSATNGGNIIGSTAGSSIEIGSTGVYQVTYTSANGCVSTNSITATVLNTAAPIAAATQTFCGNATIANLTRTGTAIKWYATATSGTVLATSTALTNNTTYFVSQTLNGCESARTAVAVILNAIPAAPTANATQTFCGSGTIANIAATGSNLKWYEDADLETALATSTTLTDNTTYYVTQKVNGCESTTTAVLVTINAIPAAPLANANQDVCDNGTVEWDLFATGTNIKWYLTETGGTALAPTATLTNNATYYASQTTNGCESASRTAVTVKTNTILNVPTAPAIQTFCGAATVANLAATGTNLEWFNHPLETQALAPSTLLTNNTVYYVSQTFADGCQTFRTVVTVFINTTNWNGTAWSNGLPTASKGVVISGNFTASESLMACSLEVMGNSIVNVPSGYNFTVSGKVKVAPTASLTFENNANLVQIDNVQNEGAIIVKRDSNVLKRLDYTLWSSPVAGTQTLNEFSLLTLSNRFYTYNANSNLYTATAPTAGFGVGTGYLIRMPDQKPGSLGITTPYYLGNETLVYKGIFTGVPNNGTITLNSLASNKYYAIGNPYPSTISATSFLDGNTTDGTLYFWRKTNGVAGSAYATYTRAGGAGTNGIIPNGTIQVGQGFIVKATSNTLTFTNAMRTNNTQNQFLKTKAETDKSRVWLSLSDTKGSLNQTMIAYMNGATLGVDAGYDGKYINDSKIALTSSIEGQEYSIQARPTFDATDVVALHFKTDVAGSYSIALDAVDGVFTSGQDIYLIDKQTGTETNLKTAAYTFAASVGEAKDRFWVKYQKTLKIENPVFNESTVIVFRNNGVLTVSSTSKAIKNIHVYDVRGRLLAQQMNVNATKASFNNLKTATQVLIVKVIADDNTEVSKKVLN